jgi:hypothetical protein
VLAETRRRIKDATIRSVGLLLILEAGTMLTQQPAKFAYLNWILPLPGAIVVFLFAFYWKKTPPRKNPPGPAQNPRG